MNKADIKDNSVWFSKPADERCLLSLCLKSMPIFIEVSSRIKAEDFLDKNNRAIFAALYNLASVGIEEFDLASVVAYCGDLGILQEIGGYSYVDALLNSDVSRLNLDVYVKRVLNASMLHKLNGVLSESVNEVCSVANSVDYNATEVINSIEDRVLSVALDTLKIEDAKLISSGLKERIQEFENNPRAVVGLQTGFTILDSLINGLERSKLYVVAARPKIGKSMLLMNWAVNMCTNPSCRTPVLYLDTEMDFEEVQSRMLSSLASVPEQHIVKGLFAADEKQRKNVYYAAEIMEKMEFIHKYIPSFKIEDIKGLAKKYKAKNNIGALFFDYIKMVDLNEGFNETQTLGHLAITLKDLAGTLNIPVITAVQLGRTAQDKSLVSQEMVGDSDRILRYCNVLMALTKKSVKEIQEEGPECGTHRLQILANRSGLSLYRGVDLAVKRTMLTIREAGEQSTNSHLEQKEMVSLLNDL